MNDTASKATNLLRKLDLSRPELAAVRASDKPAEAFVAWLNRQPRPRPAVDVGRKAEVLAYLQANYGGWRHFDRTPAEKLAAMPMAQATVPDSRATADIAALGQAWWATGEERFGRAFERFYIETATGGMFNWGAFNGYQGRLELDAFFLLLDCPGFTTAGRIAYLDHLHAIADFAWDHETSRWNHLMLGPEGHNWYLHGMICLPFVGLLFPEFSRAPFLLRTGVSVIEEHLRGHYKEDGGARETTPGYQVGSLHHLWDFALLARRNGFALPPEYTERLLCATRFILRLMTPDGGIPVFGDTGNRPGCLTELASLAAVATGDRECKWYAEYARARRVGAPAESPDAVPYPVFWLVGLEGAQAYARIRPQDPRLTSVLMGPTGYAALRSAAAPDAAYLAVAAADRGPVVTSHGHTDIFSLEVHANGVKFVGAPSCAPYGTSPGRVYDQKTEAHTCLTVDDRDQIAILDEWRWSERLNPCVRRWISEPTHDFFHGVHEGYYYYRRGEVLHARKILFLRAIPGGRAGYWIVMDRLLAAGEHDYAAYFHGCVPGRLDGGNVLLGSAPAARLSIQAPDNDGLRAEAVRSAGLAALVAELQLKPENHPAFVFRRRGASDCLAFALTPLAAGEAAPRVERVPVSANGAAETPAEACALKLTFADHTDWLCISHKDFDAELAFGPHTAWGNLVFRRVAADGRVVAGFEHTMADGTCGR